MEDQKQTESLDQGATNDSSSSREPDATVSLVDRTNGLNFHNEDTHDKSKVNHYEEVSGRMNKIFNEESGSEGINETIRTDGSNKVGENKKDNETVSLCADGTVDKGENTAEQRSSEIFYRRSDTPNYDRNNEETQNCNNANDKGYNETSDTSHAEKTIPRIDKTTHGRESDENKTENDGTSVLLGKPPNEKHNEASYNREGETNNAEKGIVTENINADQIDANAKGETCEGDSSSNKEGNNSETPDEKMITNMDRQETANKETNDETIPEGTFYNKDTNIPQDAPMACPNESPEAYVESYGKKKKGSIGGVVQDVNPFKRETQKKKNETHIPSSQPKQPSVTNSIEEDMTSHDDKKSASSNETHMFNLGFIPKTKSNKKKDTDITDSQAKEALDACRSMADQNQTESLDEGATKDLSSIIAPGATVNSGDKTRGLAFHIDSTDNESSAEGNEGVNGMTNKSTNEESRIDVNDKIADDEHDIIHDTIRKGGSNKVDENKKGNETVSLCADETVGKKEDTVGKRLGETFYRGSDTKNNESNDKVTQKSNNGANDKENKETGDTSHTETKTGTNKKTHAGERHENKTSNDETNVMTSKPADERNDEATQKGNNANDKGNNKGNDTSQAEKIKTRTSKITHEGESDENKTDNDETNVLISAPTDDGNDEETQHSNNPNDKGYNENNDTSHTEKIKTGTGKITHEGVSDENKTDNDETNVLMCKPDNVKHNEASNNGEGETNNDGSEIIPEDVKPDQTDDTVKERSQTFEDDSCSNETLDEKMISDLDRQETAKKETNDEIIPEGTFYKEDANRQKETTMTRSNESPAENEEAQDKKKKGFFAGVRQNVSSIKGRFQNKKNEKHIPVRQSKQPSDTNSIEEDVKPHDDKKSASSSEKQMFNIGFLPKTKSNKKKDTDISESQAKEDPDACSIEEDVNPHDDKKNASSSEKHMFNIRFFPKTKSNKKKDMDISDSQATEAPYACSIEEDVKPHDDKKSASSNETHMFNIGFLQKTKSNKKKDRDISDSQAKEAPDACRGSMPIQDENKQWKKKHQELINQTREEKESNAFTVNETTTLLRARDRELKEYRADISQLTAQIQQLQEDKSDLLLRLSKVESAKLTQNNPNIADLSDANRPTKLAEQFSELYNNEYTDAIEEQQGIEEQAAVENMLTLLQAANEECVELARKQEDGKTCLTTFSFKVDQYPILRERSVLTDSGDNECSTVKSTTDQETGEVRIEIQLPDEHSKSLSDIRRLCATKVEEDSSMSEIIASKIALERGIKPESGPKTLAYITKCAKLCWYMVIKEPPVLVGFHAVVDGEPFNKDTYSAYTKAGDLLDFIVWPPLYLHKDGPLLCKGVAQGK